MPNHCQNKKYTNNYPSKVLTFYQFGVGAVILLPFILIEKFSVTAMDIALLVLLGAVFTVGGYTLFINALKYLKAQRVSIIATLEPVYSIALAFFILGEIPELRTIAGGALILAASVYTTLRKSR
ncbi:DMT family transporter [Candidatus Dependentiae bacterium]|nr:DMT family transporter [Candidatus Dependentiae bacterium]